MAQGYTGYNIIENAITIKDGANLDAFSRLRVSNPLTIFSNQFTYDASPLLFEQIVSGTIGAPTITYDSTNRLMVLSIAGGTGGDAAVMQSYEYIPYQPGRSQLVFITFNFFPGVSVNNNSIKTVGLGEILEGFFFQYNGATARAEFVIASTTLNGSQVVSQNFWNLDRLNGSGPSGITLDLTETQILVIDFQALYVGRVRFGFDIGGEIIYAHEFLNANSLRYPYIATANLPIFAGITGVALSIGYEEMYFICCSVASEGGLEDSQRFGYNFSYNNSLLTVPATLSHVASIRPTTTFGGITNRVKFVLEEIEILNTGNRPIFWLLGIDAKVNAPNFNAYNLNYSAMEIDVVGVSLNAPAVVFDSGYIASGTGTKSTASSRLIQSKYPITLDAAGLPRDAGTVSLYANGVGGTSTMYYVLKWKEIR